MTYNVFSGTLNPTQSINLEMYRNGGTDHDAIWVVDLGGPRNHVLDGIQIPHEKRQF